MKKQKGFSLIELLIVVAIILIIAAIAVPNLLRSRMAANESSAAGSERTLATSNVTYSTTWGVGYAGEMSHMGPSTSASSDAADLIDATLAGATVSTAPKSGYWFTYTAGPAGAAPASDDQNTAFSILGLPASTSTGTSAFCVDQTNVVKKDPAGDSSGPDDTGCNTFSGPPL